MYPRCTRSGLRLTCVTYSRKLYSNRGTFCARKCGYKLQLYGEAESYTAFMIAIYEEKCMKIKKYNNKICSYCKIIAKSNYFINNSPPT